jgi:hypothetical protein
MKSMRSVRRVAGLLCLFASALSISGPVSAGSAGLGTIVVVLPHYAGLFFNSTGSRVSAPACAGTPARWVINVNTPQGQMMAAALLTAQSRGKRVSVYGTGDCAVWFDTETVAYFQIED